MQFLRWFLFVQSSASWRMKTFFFYEIFRNNHKNQEEKISLFIFVRVFVNAICCKMSMPSMGNLLKFDYTFSDFTQENLCNLNKKENKNYALVNVVAYVA
jgi:hypothetical protein